jgi:hypothetical protein
MKKRRKRGQGIGQREQIKEEKGNGGREEKEHKNKVTKRRIIYFKLSI